MKLILGVAMVGAMVIGSPNRAVEATLTQCLGQPATIIATTGTVSGTSGPDVIAIPSGSNVTVNANGGNDTICSESDSAVVHGGNGNDRIDGVGQLYGDANNDNITSKTLVSGRLGVAVYGGAGNDFIEVEDGVFVDGGSGDDQIIVDSTSEVHGGSGNDSISTTDTNRIFGDSGDDSINAFRPGLIDCGSGRDRYSFETDSETPTITRCEIPEAN
jgi:Ca2+-binding RTX toxin-like protein